MDACACNYCEEAVVASTGERISSKPTPPVHLSQDRGNDPT